MRSNIRLYRSAGRYQEAAQLAEQMLKDAGLLEAGENAHLQLQLADLLELAGRPDDATKHRRLAQTLQRMAGGSEVS